MRVERRKARLSLRAGGPADQTPSAKLCVKPLVSFEEVKSSVNMGHLSHVSSQLTIGYLRGTPC